MTDAICGAGNAQLSLLKNIKILFSSEIECYRPSLYVPLSVHLHAMDVILNYIYYWSSQLLRFSIVPFVA